MNDVFASLDSCHEFIPVGTFNAFTANQDEYRYKPPFPTYNKETSELADEADHSMEIESESSLSGEQTGEASSGINAGLSSEGVSLTSAYVQAESTNAIETESASSTAVSESEGQTASGGMANGNSMGCYSGLSM